MLVLGGRNYVGPHLIQAALERGHEVTMFNRGFTNRELFSHVEHLEGNRFPDRGRGLEALRGGREWDVVFDTWAREPGCVNDAADLLEGRAGRYVYVSSIAVHDRFDRVGMDERSSTVEAQDLTTSFDPDMGYPHRKRAGELAVSRHFGDDAVVLRCSTVRGFDASASPKNQQSYWWFRFQSGEPVLIPDDPTALIQWTDARDIGRFAVFAAEEQLGGTYNLMNTREPLPFLEFLDAMHEATGRRAAVVRAPRPFLEDRGIRPWDDLPQWIPGDDAAPGFFQVRADRARATGFRFRPLGQTLSSVLRTYSTTPAPDTSEQLSRERELELIWELVGGDLPG